MKKVLSENTIRDVNIIKEWKRETKTIEIEAQAPNKLNSKRSQYNNRKNQNSEPNKDDFNMGGKFEKDKKPNNNNFDIKIGVKDSI